MEGEILFTQICRLQRVGSRLFLKVSQESGKLWFFLSCPSAPVVPPSGNFNVNIFGLYHELIKDHVLFRHRPSWCWELENDFANYYVPFLQTIYIYTILDRKSVIYCVIRVWRPNYARWSCSKFCYQFILQYRNILLQLVIECLEYINFFITTPVLFHDVLPY